MKLTRNKIFSGIFIFWPMINFFALFDIKFLYLRAVFSFAFLITIPGLLIMLMLKIRKIGFWEYLVYTIGLSIAFLMFAGLLINWVLPLIGINQPLSLEPLTMSFHFLLTILALVAFLRNKNLTYKFKLPRLSSLNWCFFLALLIFPILSILGAVSLNNQGSNYLTLMMLGGIALYVCLIIIFRKRLNPNIYPLAIFLIALSLLLMTSLRGWYITGHDIKQEYYVFQLTKNHYYWSMSYFHDAYNACLSLNILPTIFSSFLNINDMYIYKILFQIIFPFSVVGIFLALKKYTTDPMAFLSAFYFMSFPTFLNDMPMQNRQEIALFFFALIMLMLFNQTIKPRLKEILFLIFGFSMIVSHYSTSYVAIALFVLTYLISFILKRNFIKEKIKIGNGIYYLTWEMVLGIVVFTFIWNIQLTRTSGGLQDLIFQTYKNIGKSFSQDLKSGDVLYSLFSWQKLDKAKLLNEYLLATTKEAELRENKDLYFEKGTYEKYNISLLDDTILPLTSLGRKLTNISLNVFLLNYYFRQSIAKIVQLFAILGLLVFILNKSQYIRDVDAEYNVLAFVSIFLMGLLILLPMFSIEYGTLRFFQQTLIVLALPTVIGSSIIFRFLNKKTRLYVIVSIFVIFFLSLSGFAPQILGSYYPQLHLNNQGSSYDCFYLHKSEVISINWLKNNFSDKYDIQSNEYMHFKMLVIAGLTSAGNLLPATIKKDDYVYLDYSNVKNKKNILYFKGNSFIHNYPIEFLDENKNLIYNNSGSKIYK